MLPMKALRLALGALLAADTSTLAPAVANKIHLAMNNFALNEDLAIGDLTEATFTGATALAGSTGSQEVGVDPRTQQQVVEIKAPVGGYRWITADAVNLPQTIYGFYLTDTTGATLLAAGQLPIPLTLQAAGQFVSIDPVIMTMVVQPLN